MAGANTAAVTMLGIDETAFLRARRLHHTNCVSGMVDTATGRLLDAVPGSFGAGLTRWLRHEGFVVDDVNRPDRATRRHRGKSDTIDAESAARAVLAGVATTVPKAADGPVESLLVLPLVRRSAVKARTQVANQLHALVLTAPAAFSEQLRKLKMADLVATAARFRPDQAVT